MRRRCEIACKRNERKTEDFEGCDGLLPSRAKTGIGRFGGALRWRVEIREGTCLALRIDADGSVTLANAGHVAPYLNGEELPMEGALPLGMIEGAEFSVMRFQLKVDDKLVLMSDGIAEATDAAGRLLGFERVNELLRTATTAARIATAAQTFGQEDDISVISVTRTATLESAAA